MQTPTHPPAAGWSDTLKLIVVGSFVAIVAFIWKLIRPIGGRVIFYFIEHDDMRDYFRQYVARTMPHIDHSLTSTASAVRTLQATVAEIAATQQRQHSENVGAMTLNREGLEQLDTKMDRVTEALARIEGREDARYQKRGTR
jgi:hypothetical protein